MYKEVIERLQMELTRLDAERRQVSVKLKYYEDLERDVSTEQEDEYQRYYELHDDN